VVKLSVAVISILETAQKRAAKYSPQKSRKNTTKMVIFTKAAQAR
jgi:hypothetical protein